MTFRIEKYDGLARTPALPLLVAGWHEVLQQELCDDAIMFVQWNDLAICAFEESTDIPVGACSFEDGPAYNTFLLKFIYVRPDFRCRGIGMQLLARIREEARLSKRPIVQTFIRTGNHESAALFRKFGATVLGREFVFLV